MKPFSLQLLIAVVSFCGISFHTDSALAQASGILKGVGPWSEKGPPFKVFSNIDNGINENVGIKSQGTTIRSTYHKLNIFSPLWKNSHQEFGILASAEGEDFRTNALFPTSRTRFPTELWRTKMGVFYRHRFSNEMILGGNLSVGSDSDDPFAQGDVISVQANLFLRYPVSKKSAWLFFLNYSNNRTFAQNIPLPGVAFWYEPNGWFRLIVGIPFVALEISPLPGALKTLKFSLTYFLIRNVQAEISYKWKRLIKVFFRFHWKGESYLIKDREERDDRLYYYEKRVYGGVEFTIMKNLSLGIQGGFKFDRFYYIGEDYSDRFDDRLSLKKGGYASVRLSLRF